MTTELLENMIIKLDKFLRELNGEGCYGRFFSTWPVIVKGGLFNSKIFEYCYPYPFFDNLEKEVGIRISYDSKSERRLFIKMAIDKLMNREIDIFSYHFCMYLLYRTELKFKQKEELTEETIGKKRFSFIQGLPEATFKNTEAFITEIWSDQIKKWDTEHNEYRYNPSMENVRILFTPAFFGDFTGHYYDEAAFDWVEPISGAVGLKCKTYTQETDPMITAARPEGWVQGKIDGYDNGGGYRHSVAGVPVHCGSAIKIKFGKGWIDGRYECDLVGRGSIQVWSGHDVFFINEGHEVRIRG